MDHRALTAATAGATTQKKNRKTFRKQQKRNQKQSGMNSSGDLQPGVPLELHARLKLLEQEQGMHLRQIGQLSRSVAQLASENQRLRAAVRVGLLVCRVLLSL